MPDVVTTVLTTLAAGGWGAIGGFIYWAIPARPDGLAKFAQRIGGGFVAGVLAFALLGTTPFDATGAWDVGGVTQLVGLGLAGIAGLATFLGPTLNENARKVLDELEGLRAESAGP